MVRLKVHVAHLADLLQVFQFLYGAIKSQTNSRFMSLPEHHFNSSMVRLKDEQHHAMYASGDFNSSMVRLKGMAARPDSPTTCQFQFLYGAIKSYPNSWYLLNGQPHFNSSMVRLKGAVIPAVNLVVGVYFNSSMVRLKDNSRLTASVLMLNFNSSMVRLKAFILFT